VLNKAINRDSLKLPLGLYNLPLTFAGNVITMCLH